MNHLTKAALLGLALPLLTAPLAAQAQPTVLSGDHSVTGKFFVLGRQLNIEDRYPRLIFRDTSGPGSQSWWIEANNNIEKYFAIVTDDPDDYENPYDKQVFRIESGARNNALFVAADGNVGLGTSLPLEDLHIEGGTQAAIRLRAATTSAGAPRSFQLNVNGAGFGIFNAETGVFPFAVNPSAPQSALDVGQSEVAVNTGNANYDFRVGGTASSHLFFVDAAEGAVGIGTGAPAAPLHVSSDNTFAFFRIEATGATPNTAADMTYTQGPTGNGEYRINVVDGDGPEMRVNGEGYVIATTGFRVGSTDLTVPDYVFEPDYELRPLSEVATFIEQNKHLPDVPSAAQVADEGLDMTQMQMALLKKVEELTLYTLEQQALTLEQQALNDAQAQMIEDLLARLAVVEAKS